MDNNGVVLHTEKEVKLPGKWDRFQNLKNGQKYIVIRLATESTNNRAGVKTVVYEDRDGNWYVRQVEEFLQKFRRVD